MPETRERNGIDGEDLPLTEAQIKEFLAALDATREASGGFAVGTDESPEAEARRRFFEELDLDDI